MTQHHEENLMTESDCETPRHHNFTRRVSIFWMFALLGRFLPRLGPLNRGPFSLLRLYWAKPAISPQRRRPHRPVARPDIFPETTGSCASASWPHPRPNRTGP